MQSLANIGDWQSLKVLARIAKDYTYSPDKNMQLLAINGLTKNHLKNSSFEFVSAIFLIIYVYMNDKLCMLIRFYCMM